MDDLPVMPGFREMALRRMAGQRAGLVRDLAAQRQAAGLSQTEVAARMGTSQSAVARLESGATDIRASTLERYAAAIGGEITWRLNEESRLQPRRPGVPVARPAVTGDAAIARNTAGQAAAGPGSGAARPGLA